MTTVAIYARFSSELQRDTSLDDQVRTCREHAARQGWEVVAVYRDRARTGENMLRPGLQALMEGARAGDFDVVLCEALDRLSRDQADIAAIYKELSFADIALHSLSEGAVDQLHIGLKGTMNALFLTDLKRKIRRGLSGRIEAGRSAGGLPYGYEVVHELDDRGEPLRGGRRINEAQAAVVRRIHEEYASGASPRAIVHRLNAEGVPGPTGKGWAASSINGNRKRGLGILNNEIYAGTLVWNRQRFVKDPATGKRVTRLNPESEWQRQDVPELRIVPADLWDRVKARQAELTFDHSEGAIFNRAKRPRYLTTGLIKCGECGGSFVMSNHARMGCATLKEKGTCGNGLKIGRVELEKMILAALQHHLMQDDLCAEFCAAYVKHMNELAGRRSDLAQGWQDELAALERSDRNIAEAVADGFASPALKERSAANAARRQELTRLLETTEAEPTVRLHPAMGKRYRQAIEGLVATLEAEGRGLIAATGALDILRGLIDRVVVTPDASRSRLVVDLHGDLASILALALGKGKAEIGAAFELSETQLVAEDRYQLNLLFSVYDIAA